MKSFIHVLFCFVAVRAASGNSCGGFLMTDLGLIDVAPDLTVNKSDHLCMWNLRLPSVDQFIFTVHRLSQNWTLSLYFEHRPTIDILTPTRLTSEDVGVPKNLHSHIVIIILSSDYQVPIEFRDISFSWERGSSPIHELNGGAYADGNVGRFEWKPWLSLSSPTFVFERFSMVINTGSEKKVWIHGSVKFDPDVCISDCNCYFRLFEVTPRGELVEVTKICSRSSNFDIDPVLPCLILFSSVQVSFEQPNVPKISVEVSWEDSKALSQ